MKQSMSCDIEERILAALRVWWKTQKMVRVMSPERAADYFRLLNLHGTN